MNINELIEKLRERIENDYYEFGESMPFEDLYKFIDDYINDSTKSILERAFFLILHQFPSDKKDYIVRPNERVLIPDIYDMSSPGVEYEIDFALYGGSIDNPVKVAIECDGLRSHRQKHGKRDRRKEVNLQAAGWLVMRFRSKEIQDELEKFDKEEHYISDFLFSIENTIKQKLKVITHNTFLTPEYRNKLTGYKWDRITCTICGHKQMDTLNHKKLTCRKCGKKFYREIKPDEKIKYDFDGLLYFEE